MLCRFWQLKNKINIFFFLNLKSKGNVINTGVVKSAKWMQTTSKTIHYYQKKPNFHSIDLLHSNSHSSVCLILWNISYISSVLTITGNLHTGNTVLIAANTFMINSCRLNITGCETVQLIIQLMIPLMIRLLPDQLATDGTASVFRWSRQTDLMERVAVFTVA